MTAVPGAISPASAWRLAACGQVCSALDAGERGDNRAAMPTNLTTLARSSAVHVAFAFLAMGGWAVFANRSAGSGHALTAGLVQGALSGGITLGLKRFLETASARLSGVWAVVAPPTISCAVILVLLISAHLIAGTRNVLATISLPYAVSSTYAWVYTWAVTRRRTAGATA
jgi:hypothetical protein